MGRIPEHYSYRIYADKSYAQNYQDDRYGGPFGSLLLEQEKQVFSRLLSVNGRKRILDAGTGSGKLAINFASKGMQVVAIDASPQMLQVALQQAKAEEVEIDFLLGDLHRLSFPPRSFDGAVSSRVLMHLIDWKSALAQLCLVSDKAIVLDFPPAYSISAIGPLIRRFKRLLGIKAEGHRTFTITEITTELTKNGFRPTRVHRGYFLPIRLHRILGNTTLSMKLEELFSYLGLNRFLGAPVVIGAERCQ